MSKLFWSTEEWAQLRAQAILLLKETPYARVQNVLSEAQLVLPPGRRRKMTYAAAYRYRSFVEECRALAKDQPQAPPKVVEPAPAPTDPLRALLDQVLDALVDKLMERIELRVQGDAISVRPRAPQDNCIVERCTGKPGVLIVGLLGAQAANIMKAFPNLEISCMTSEEALRRDKLLRAHTVLMTKFISHSVQEKYRKAPQLHLCNGGLSELTALLGEIR